MGFNAYPFLIHVFVMGMTPFTTAKRNVISTNMDAKTGVFKFCILLIYFRPWKT